MSIATRVPDKVFVGDFSDVTTPSGDDHGYAFVWDDVAQAAVWTAFEEYGAVATHLAEADPHTQYQLVSGLGTAAFLNVGTGANEVVQLTAASKLPAVDGSLLTNLPGGGSPGGSTTQVQRNLAGAFAGDSGFTSDGAGAVTLSAALVAPVIAPASNSTTAVKITKADKTTAVITVDTTNNRVGIGNTPSEAFEVTGSAKLSTSLISPVWKPASDSTTAMLVAKTAGTAVVTYDTTNSRMTIHGPNNGAASAAPINAPLQIQVDASGRAFVLSNSSTEYTDFISGGALKGMRGTGTVPFVISNAGDIYLSGGNTERFRASSTGIGFFAVAPVARASAYTQTYATATKTLSAYTADAESSTYTGIDNAQGGTVYATVADLNALRVAYETLRAFAENTTKVLNSVVDDFQAYGLLQ